MKPKMVAMKPKIVAILSLSEIASATQSQKLRPLHDEIPGGVSFLNLEAARFAEKFDHNASLVILNYPQWSGERLPSVFEIQSVAYQGQILALVSDFDHWNELMSISTQFKQFKLLSRPFSDAQLIGYVRRLLSCDSPNFRFRPRFETDQLVKMTVAESTFQCLLKNVSKGGACVQFANELPFALNDFVDLHVSFDGNIEQHSVYGRIAWIHHESLQAGIQFVNWSSEAKSA